MRPTRPGVLAGLFRWLYRKLVGWNRGDMPEEAFLVVEVPDGGDGRWPVFLPGTSSGRS